MMSWNSGQTGLHTKSTSSFPSITMENQLLSALMRLKLGLVTYDVALRFKISASNTAVCLQLGFAFYQKR